MFPIAHLTLTTAFFLWYFSPSFLVTIFTMISWEIWKERKNKIKCQNVQTTLQSKLIVQHSAGSNNSKDVAFKNLCILSNYWLKVASLNAFLGFFDKYSYTWIYYLMWQPSMGQEQERENKCEFSLESAFGSLHQSTVALEMQDLLYLA